MIRRLRHEHTIVNFVVIIEREIRLNVKYIIEREFISHTIVINSIFVLDDCTKPAPIFLGLYIIKIPNDFILGHLCPFAQTIRLLIVRHNGKEFAQEDSEEDTANDAFDVVVCIAHFLLYRYILFFKKNQATIK